NAVVHFAVDGSPIADTTTADGSGAWTFNPTGLADGPHTLVASETDAAGNTGSASLSFTLDTVSPPVTLALANGNSPLATGAVAVFDFDEISGSIAHDTAGNHDGTIVGTVSHVAGVSGNALQFDGGSYVSIPNSPDWNFGSGDFTITLWANFASV